MTDAELDAYRLRLLAELQALADQASASKDARNTVTLDQQAVGRLSRMDALQQQAMAQATERRRQGEARAIRAALSRIDGGEFGYCHDCGEAIAAERLAAKPTIRLCMSCARG